MILLNALYKGLVGAMGALLCYLLYLLFHYYRFLFKKYRLFLKTSDASSITWWEVILFAIINFFVVWVVVFGLFSAIFDWRTLSADENAVIALFAGLVFVGVIIFSYRKYFRRINLKSSKYTNTISQSSSQLPNTKSDIVKFNYFYSFKHLPILVEKYVKGECSFEDIISLNTISQEYGNLAKKVEIISSSLNNVDDIELTLFTVPSTGKISEVNSLLLIRKPSTHQATLYSLEYSLGDFCICSITAESHSNLGLFVSNGEEFATSALKHFISRQKSDEIVSSSDMISEEVSSENKNAHSTESNLDDLFEYKPQKDIYGTPLTERLKDIYSSIQYGLDTFCENLTLLGLPCLSQQGKQEVAIYLGAMLSLNIQKDIVIQSILQGDKSLNSLGIKFLDEKIDTYVSMYKSQILRDYVKQTWSLMDFARNNGKMKLASFEAPDSYGYTKRPAFCMENQSPLICHFAAFEKDNLTPAYIISHKNDIIVEERTNGDYVLRPMEDVSFFIECYVSYVAYHVFCHPLKYFYSLNYSDIDEEISKLPVSESRVSITYKDMPNPSLKFYSLFRSALDEGKKEAENIAVATGIYE